jgi:hypothetical protein
MSRLRRRLIYAGLWLKSVVLRSISSSVLYGLAVESYEDNDDQISSRSVALAAKGPFGERWPTQLGRAT